MSALEAAAARVLPTLILEGRGDISSSDGPLIAAWVQKTALVSMLLSSREQRANGYGLPASEYRSFFEAGRAVPLPDTMAWIGRYDGNRVRASTCVTPMVVRIAGASALETPQGYLVTIVLGKLLLHLLRFTTPRLAIDVDAGDKFCRLWPSDCGRVSLGSRGIYDNRINKIEKGAAVRSCVAGVLLEHWKPATELAQSALLDSMVKLPTPCGEHFIFYPASLAAAGIRGTSHAFHTRCGCGTSYLIVTEEDGAHFKLEGSTEVVTDAYERSSGEELTLEDENGVFWCKRLAGEWED